MATGTAATVARKYHQDVVHTLSKAISYADGASNVYTIGVIPAGALINKASSGVHITTAFNAGTGNVIDVGTTADDDLFGTDLAAGTATFVPLDEAIGGYYVSQDTTITATLALTGTAASAGAGYVVINYSIVNRSL